MAMALAHAAYAAYDASDDDCGDPDPDPDTLAPLDAHSLYTHDALHHRLLGADEERELARRWREDRDLAARDTLITHNLRLVYAIAARDYHTTHLSQLDLVQEGTIGLMHAIEKFDERTGHRFTTYATYWIRQAVGRAVMAQETAIPAPMHVHETRARLRREATRLTAELGREPTAAEVRLAAGVTSVGMVACLAAADQTRSVLSLDTPISATMSGVSGEQTIGDTIPDLTAADGDATAERRAGLWRVCRQVLTPRQAQVIALRFGLGAGASDDAKDDANGERITDGVWASVPMGKLSHFGVQMSTAGTSRTLEEVGHLLGICRERVRQIEARALTTLRERLTLAEAGSDSDGMSAA